MVHSGPDRGDLLLLPGAVTDSKMFWYTWNEQSLRPVPGSKSLENVVEVDTERRTPLGLM